jgi:tetrahydromethanopterin S-methyltransferase subunit B
MPDRENVISTLEEIKTQTAGIGLDSAVIAHTFIDKIIALLKEQEERIDTLETILELERGQNWG